jgi:hypothetical protein
MSILQNKKLVELASKAVSINEELLKEEREFINAVKEDKEITALERMSERINLLVRKEHLFLGAVQLLIKKISRSSKGEVT